jgi:hypothetical protein
MYHLGQTNYIIKIRILNSKIRKALTRRLIQVLTKYKHRIFNRQINLYYDTMRTLNLYHQNKIHVSGLLLVFSSIFKYLKKKLHKFFLNFITDMFTFILKYKPNPRYYNITKGLKFKINGRLFGKRRASSIVMILGDIPNQSIEKYIDYAFIHTFTRYGAYGMHIWNNKY